VPARLFLHAHHGFQGRVPINTEVSELLGMIPEALVCAHDLRIPGHMCSAIATKPGRLAAAHQDTLTAMREVGADTLVTIFHSCHRDAVALERGRDIRVVNWIHLLAEAMGLDYTDEYKTWRNAGDPRAAVGAERIAGMGEVAFERLVEPELSRPPVL
jgi:hypothetical protein